MPWRPLTPDEVELYDVLPTHLARRVRVVRVRALPRGYGGMTLGRLVLLTRPVPPDRPSALLAHELVHVRQWAEFGVVGFLSRYLADFVRGLVLHRRWDPAYRAIRFEQLARQEAEDWSHRLPAGRPSPGPTGDGPPSGSTGDGGEALP